MTKQSTSFIDYWRAVDAALMRHFGIDTADAGIEAALIAEFQEAGDTPEDFAHWYGKKYDLTYIDDWKARYGRGPEIAALNDLARRAMGLACRVVQTPGIAALPPEDQSAIREKVETFDTFTPDNDPYGEHDFGAFEHKGKRIFWKIDYYNRTLSGGSEDPADAKKTIRVLTIMLASEY